MRTLPTLLFCAALVINTHVLAAETDLLELRKLYYMACEDKRYNDRFYARVNDLGEARSPLAECYKGMALFLRCRQEMNPYYKLSDFSAGKKLLERAVKLDPGNVEIRFMRFCIQSQAPRMLGYYGRMAEDKHFIIDSWKKIPDPDLKDRIRAFMLVYGNISEQEKAHLQ